MAGRRSPRAKKVAKTKEQLAEQYAKLDKEAKQAFLDEYQALVQKHGYEFMPVAQAVAQQGGQIVIGAAVDIVPVRESTEEPEQEEEDGV